MLRLEEAGGFAEDVERVWGAGSGGVFMLWGWRRMKGEWRAAALAAAFAGSTLAHAARTVVDETGQRVTVPDHPHRVICLVPSVVDSVFALGAGEDVVGVSDYVKYPAEAVGKPRVGSILTPSLETVVALHPDLLLATKTEGGAAAVEKFRRMGIPIYLIDPHGIEGIFQSITDLGEALNREAQARTEVEGLRGRVARLRASVQGKPVVSVFFPIWYDPVITIGHGAFMTEMIAAAGGRSITDDLPQEWPQISMETVVARAPEALLLVRGGGVSLAVLRSKAGWRSVPAVKMGRVYLLDARMELSSPVALDALEDLARQLHP